jgi:hypothetical protein
MRQILSEAILIQLLRFASFCCNYHIYRMTEVTVSEPAGSAEYGGPHGSAFLSIRPASSSAFLAHSGQ